MVVFARLEIMFAADWSLFVVLCNYAVRKIEKKFVLRLLCYVLGNMNMKFSNIFFLDKLAPGRVTSPSAMSNILTEKNSNCKLNIYQIIQS